MRLQQFENDKSIVDQIIDDFEVRDDDSPTPERDQIAKAPFKAPPSTSREPVTIQGVDHNSFSQWLRSKEEVRKAIQQNLNTPKVTLKNCIALYTEYNIKIDDFVVLTFPTTDVYPYREYDREMKNGFTGKMDQEEYTDLMKSISKNGIRNPGILDIVNLKGGDYEAQLGEGNHRLKVAIALDKDTYPISFSYRFG